MSKLSAKSAEGSKKIAKSAPAKKAAAPKVAKEKKASVGRAGSNATFTVVAKDNPFRAGTVRHGLWAHLKASKTAAEARKLDPKISISFLRELNEKGVIKLVE